MNFHPFSLTDLRLEKRKQRAHLKKIDEMKSRSGLDDQEPLKFPHLRLGFKRQMTEKREQIVRENERKSKKLFEIMTARKEEPIEPFHPKHRSVHNDMFYTPINVSEYEQRINKVKGKYDVRQWSQSFKKHNEYLEMRKNNHVFTPLDIGRNKKLANTSRSTDTKTC